MCCFNTPSPSPSPFKKRFNIYNCNNPVYQSWVFTGRTDVEAETPTLWPPDVESGLIWKDPDAGKDWGQEEKGTTEDEMAGWHHRLDGHGFGWTLGVGAGQGGLSCCSSWGRKESDMTEWLNWNWKSSILQSQDTLLKQTYDLIKENGWDDLWQNEPKLLSNNSEQSQTGSWLQSEFPAISQESSETTARSAGARCQRAVKGHLSVPVVLLFISALSYIFVLLGNFCV